MSKKITIKEVQKKDLQEIAKIHLSAFPDSLITRLGLDCVIRYYDWQLKSKDRIYAITAWYNDRIIGYCFGGVFTMALGGFLVENKFFIFKRVIACPWIIFNSDFIKKFSRGFILLLKFSIFKSKNEPNESNSDELIFGILSIASDIQLKGLGVGKLLMVHSERFAKKNKFNKMYLSVSPYNLNAIQFYEHIGWNKEYEAGKWKGGMQKDISNV